MKVITLSKGEEIKLTENFKEFWLNEIDKEGKEGSEICTYAKPTYSSEFDSTQSLHCNYNYDGMTPTIKFDPDTKVLKAVGYGYNKITLTFN